MHQTESIVALLAALIIVGLLTGGLLLWRQTKASKGEYQAVPLLSAAEAELYRSLAALYSVSAVICPKVRLLDLIRPRKDLGKSEFQAAFNRVSRKHVDFVIIRTEDLAVLGVVELDDLSHDRQSRADRDEFVDHALEQAGIRICRVKARRGYDPEKLCGQLNEAFAGEVA